jgi:hypothetical protein
MSRFADEARQLRIRAEAIDERPGRLDRVPAFAAPCLIAKTTKLATYPTTAPSFYACTPATLLGSEVEGEAGTVAAGPSTFLALNLGAGVPPIGTAILATFVDCRWMFRFDG